MNKSINKIVESIMIDLKQITDESFLATKRNYIIDKIHAIRASLIRESLNDTKHIDKQFYTLWQGEITCQHRSVTINNLVFTSKTDLYTATVPTLIQDVGERNISLLGDDTFSMTFIMKTLSGFQASLYNIYTHGMPLATLVSNTLLLKNVPKSMIVVYGYILPYDPTEIDGFTNDSDYPCPSIYKLEMLLKKDLLSSWGLPLDVLKTENDESIPTSQMGRQQSKQEK